MLKKITSLLLILTLCVAVLASCGKPETPGSTETTPSTNAPESTPGTEAPSTDNKANIVKPDAAEGTFGHTLWTLFETTITATPDATIESLANTLITSEHIKFMGGSMAVEPGFLAGFKTDITGFKTAYNFGPMMGSIAFVGYIFELDESADVAAFMKTLKDNADPSWNICVTADQTLIGAVDNTVFFLMCPASSGDDVGGGEDESTDIGEVIWPEVESGAGVTLFDAFVSHIENQPSQPVAELANLLIMHESIQFMGGAMEVEPGFLAGFKTEIKDFKSAATFMPMIGSIPFVGYVFELEEGADVAAFISVLEENADPSWNICVTAEQTVIGAVGNKVFFVMCNTSLEG